MNDQAQESVETAVRALEAQYGEDALVIATLRAAEVAALGDTEALSHWDAVIARLEAGPSTNRIN